MNANDSRKCYFPRQQIMAFSRYNFAMIFLASIFMITACQPLTMPLVSDESQLKMGGALPQDQARNIVTKYVGRAWSDDPYLMCQINHLNPTDYRTERFEFNVKKNISYMDMVLRPAIGSHECLMVAINQMDVYDQANLQRIYYQPKSICCNLKEERDQLVQALISLGARVER